MLPDIVAARARVLGSEHPDTLRARHGLALNMAQVGYRAKAVRMLRELVPLYARVLGPDHPDTIDARSSLATYLRPDS